MGAHEAEQLLHSVVEAEERSLAHMSACESCKADMAQVVRTCPEAAEFIKGNVVAMLAAKVYIDQLRERVTEARQGPFLRVVAPA